MFKTTFADLARDCPRSRDIKRHETTAVIIMTARELPDAAIGEFGEILAASR